MNEQVVRKQAPSVIMTLLPVVLPENGQLKNEHSSVRAVKKR